MFASSVFNILQFRSPRIYISLFSLSIALINFSKSSKNSGNASSSTSSLIDHIVTNTPEKISHSGVIHTDISDHSLVFTIRNISVVDKQENILEIRNMKNFNDEKFMEDL